MAATTVFIGTNGGRLVALDGDGVEQWVNTLSGSGAVRGMVTDGAGHVYVAEVITGFLNLYKFDTSGNQVWLESLADYSLNNGHGNTLDYDGTHLFLAANTPGGYVLEKRDTAGALVWTSPALGFNGAVAAFGDGGAVFTDAANEVHRISSTGALVWTYNATDDAFFIDGLYEVVVDSSGNSYVADQYGAGYVFSVDSAGNYRWTQGYPLDGVYNMNIASDGTVFAFNYSINRLNPTTGAYISQVDSPAQDTQSASAIDDEDNLFLVADDNVLYKTDATGASTWTYTVGEAALTVGVLSGPPPPPPVTPAFWTTFRDTKEIKDV